MRKVTLLIVLSIISLFSIFIGLFTLNESIVKEQKTSQTYVLNTSVDIPSKYSGLNEWCIFMQYDEVSEVSSNYIVCKKGGSGYGYEITHTYSMIDVMTLGFS